MSKKPNKKVKKEVERKESASMKGAFWFFGSGCLAEIYLLILRKCFINGTLEQVRAAEDFANHLGLAFQIRDDMLDQIGNAEELGKAVHTDAVKNTFVHIYGIEECDKLVKEHTTLAKQALSAFRDSEFMLSLSDYLINRMK